mgnify:CR=1 FL=1
MIEFNLGYLPRPLLSITSLIIGTAMVTRAMPMKIRVLNNIPLIQWFMLEFGFYRGLWARSPQQSCASGAETGHLD